MLNKLVFLIKISDTQAANALIGLEISLFTESYVFCDIQSCIKWIKNKIDIVQKQQKNETIRNDENSSLKNSDRFSECEFSPLTDLEENDNPHNFINDNEDEKCT